jgi:3-oxoacyl-[acyl-carrier protein] reductase
LDHLAALDLTDRVALVTGASRGIGRSVSRLLASAGARIAVNYSFRNDAAWSLVEEIRSEGGEAEAFEADLSQPAAALQLVERTVEFFGRLDILVNNAALLRGNVAGGSDLDAWDVLFALNARGAFVATEAAIPHLALTRGSVVFVASTAGQKGSVGHAAYAASKGALLSYAKSLAAELGPRGIRVNCVSPGWVDTEMVDEMLSDPAIRKRIEDSIPLRRIATADDIAGPILFLVSDLSRHVQGEVLNVNGGSVLFG